MRMNCPPTNYDAAMMQFEQLINNKYFIVTFIETLESQKSFDIRDRYAFNIKLMEFQLNFCSQRVTKMIKFISLLEDSDFID